MAPRTGPAALVLALVTATVAAAWAARPTDYRPCRGEGRSRICVDPGSGGSSAPPALWSLLPPSGAGAPVMDPSGVCDAFASELVGSYVCLRGDGTSLLGAGVTLTKSGAVTTATPRICPNGANCDPVTVQAFDGVGRWAGNQINPPSGDFSICTLGRARQEQTMQSAGLGLNVSLLVGISTSALGRLSVNGIFTTNTATPSSGSWNWICGTYKRTGGAADNIGRFYVNGALGNTNSAMALPAATAAPFEVGHSSSTNFEDVALALYTEKELSAATISAMSQKVFGVFTAADGSTAPGFTRSSVATCKGPDGRITVLPSLRPCIWNVGGQGPMLEVDIGRTNSLIQSQALDTWTAAGATATANTAAAPASTLTADTLTDTTATSDHVVTRTVASFGVQNAAVSAFFKAGTKTIGVIRYEATHYAYVDLTTGTASATGTGATVLAEPLADGWWRLSLGIPSASTVASPTIGLGMANAAGTSSYTGDGTGTLYAWGAQLEPLITTINTTYVRTDGTATARTRSHLQASLPIGMSDAAGCASITHLRPWTHTGSSQLFNLAGDVGNAAFYLSGNNLAVNCSDGTNVPSRPVANTLTTPARWSCAWQGAVFTITTGTDSATAAYDGSILGANYLIGDKNSMGHAPTHGYVGNVKLGDKPNACQ